MSSGDEEGIDEEEMEVQLSLDEFGRIAGTSDCGLDFSSRVWAGSLTGDDKTTVATEQTVAADCDAIFDGCTTFWLPAQQEPRCSLERLARAIFEHHTRGVVFDADTSGCEFWVQVRKPLAVAPAMQIEVLPASAGMIRFHWDKDEELFDAVGCIVHPQVSTVTYLNYGGAPTLIFEHIPTLDTASEQGSDSGTAEQQDSVEIKEGWAVFPESLKHASFDGRWLHGAANFLKATDVDGDGTRRTFLVNIWLHHRPLGVDVLPAEALPLVSDLSFSYNLTPHTMSQAALSGRPYTAFFGPRGSDFKLTFDWPSTVDGMASLHLRFSEQHSATVTLAEPLDLAAVPEVKFGPGLAWAQVQLLFTQHQVLLIRGAIPALHDPKTRLARLYAAHPEIIVQNWNVESGAEEECSPEQVFAAQPPPAKRRRTARAGCYVSFVVNGDQHPNLHQAVYDAFGAPPVSLFCPAQVQHTKNMWLFFGQNLTRQSLQGRPEHTDKIPHSGTWHAQLSGTKTWFLRPDSTTVWPMGPAPLVNTPLSVTVDPGDILLINTKLWYHRTEIGNTAAAADQLSFSVAHDFYDLAFAIPSLQEVDMTNIEDSWASQDISAGTVISSELLELPSDENPNCVWRFSRGLVAIRDIVQGESLTVAPATKK